jgi:hypothetical protein
VLDGAWDTDPRADAYADPRWRVAGAMLCHEQERHGTLTSEALGLLVPITDQTEDLIACLGEEPGRADLAQASRELRDATARLHRIVEAVTAVHLL